MLKVGKRIKELRESAGLTQEELAEILGVSRPAVTSIENGSRKVSAEELVKLSRTFRLSVDAILNLEVPPTVSLPTPAKKKKRGGELRINVPRRNVEKFKEVLLYLLAKVGAKPNIGETVIYKLLYFIDFDFYEKYEEQLIGATYQKNRYGPTPMEFQKIIEEMEGEREIAKIQRPYFQYRQRKYLPLRKSDLSKLTGREIALIDDVLNRLSDRNATEMSRYSHNDVPWIVTEDGDTIEYEAVFYRTPEYSVRESDDEDEVS
ncbi:MAG: type II toxin-antitoxin system antitoxin SocA domain-containing protein [Candidatus Krumholzibacteria bacterium]